MAKPVWRLRLIAEPGPGVLCETEVARIRRNDFAIHQTLGLALDEGKRLMVATQAEIVLSQVSRWASDSSSVGIAGQSC
jgi:hypothetical protein